MSEHIDTPVEVEEAAGQELPPPEISQPESPPLDEQREGMPNERDETSLQTAMTETELAAKQEQAEKMRARLEEGYPESWRPVAEGDELIGTMLRIEFGQTSYGQCPIMVLAELLTGIEYSVWMFHTALWSKVKRLRPQPGETVGIKYLGKRDPKGGGNQYDDYQVAVDRGKTSLDWQQIEQWESGGGTPDLPGVGPASPGDDDIPF